LTKPFIATNWAQGIDAHGHARPKKEKEPKADGRSFARIRRRDELDGSKLRSGFGLYFHQRARLWSEFYMTAESKRRVGRDATATYGRNRVI